MCSLVNKPYVTGKESQQTTKNRSFFDSENSITQIVYFETADFGVSSGR